jgi:predicted DCC family thiol-disulfide oxidoreductase YuxK
VKKNFPSLYSENRDPESVILYEKGKMYFRSDAALRISRELKFPFQLIYYSRIIPVKVRDIIYRFVARHRYRFFGKRKKCFVPDKDYSKRFLDNPYGL